MTERSPLRRALAVAILLVLPIQLVPVPAAADFDVGDLYLISRALGPFGQAIARIDPLTGAHTKLIDLPDSPQMRFTFTHDPYRQRLIFAYGQPTEGLRMIDSFGSLDATITGLRTPYQVAARGDGILYFWYGSAPQKFVYMDSTDTVFDLMDSTGTAALSLGGSFGLDEMIYDPGSNSLLCFDGSSSPYEWCTDITQTCVIKIALTPDGMQAAASPVGASVEISTTPEVVVGSGLAPGGDVLFVMDTNSNNQEPRMQLVDPSTMMITTFASNGSYIGAAATNAGTYSTARDEAVILDTLANLLRAFGMGETGGGTSLGDSLSGTGSGETARLIEIRDIVTGIHPPGTGGAGWFLRPAAPNPFVAGTELRFTTPLAATVSVRVYDVAGRLVQTLSDGWRTPGDHVLTWDGRDMMARSVATGVYFARLEGPGVTLTRKLVLIK